MHWSMQELAEVAEDRKKMPGKDFVLSGRKVEGSRI